MHARQSIATRFLAPTNHRGSRIAAVSGGGIRHVGDYAQDADPIEAHAAVARELAQRLGWRGEWHVGGTRDGYVFVWIDADGDTRAFGVKG